MTICNYDKDDSTYVQLKVLIHAKSINLYLTNTILNKILAFCVKINKLHLKQVTTVN